MKTTYINFSADVDVRDISLCCLCGEFVTPLREHVTVETRGFVSLAHENCAVIFSGKYRDGTLITRFENQPKETEFVLECKDLYCEYD